MSWWQLKNIRDTHKAFVQQYYSLPPDACPNDGTPLEVGFESQSGGGRLMFRHCPMGEYDYTGGRRLT